MIKSRIEWLIIIGGLITILAVLVYCGFRIVILHRTQEKLEIHLIAQDNHMKRQDIEAESRRDNQETIMRRQQMILDAIKAAK